MDRELLHKAIDTWINRLGTEIRDEWYGEPEYEPQGEALEVLSDLAASRAYQELMKLLPQDFARENKRYVLDDESC